MRIAGEVDAVICTWSSLSSSDVGVRRATFLAFLRALTSPSGHRWQRLQVSPFAHPCGFQNHAHGSHIPLPWPNEPLDSGPVPH